MAELKVNISYPKQVQEKLNKYIIELEKAQSNAINEISAKIQDKLLENMIKYNIDSVEILGSISVNTSNEGVEIKVGAKHAIFIEFGTGIVGSENPHPKPVRANWIYGNGGWWYPTTPQKQSRYPYQPTAIINNQLYAYTKGQKSKPFLYDTWLWATRSINNIFKKHIRRIKID